MNRSLPRAMPNPQQKYRKYSRMILGVLLTLFSLYILVCGYLYCIQEQLIFAPESLPKGFTFSFSKEFTEVTLPVDGAQLNALYFKTKAPRGVILYLHGNAGSLRSWGDIADTFLIRKYDIFLLDYRGFGKSTGKITGEAMLHDDAERAYAYLTERYSEEQIIVYGRSIGSGLAARLASRHHPHMLILETPYYNFAELAAQHVPIFPSPLLRYTLRTDRWIGGVACPVYLFHGDQDRLIPYTSSQRLLPLIHSEHRLFTIPGGGHNDLSHFPEYQQGLDSILILTNPIN